MSAEKVRRDKISARRGMRTATTTGVIDEGESCEGGRANTKDKAERKTKAGEIRRRRNKAKGGSSTALAIVVIVVVEVLKPISGTVLDPE